MHLPSGCYTLNMFELFRLKKTPAVLLCLEPNVTVPKVPQGSQDVQKRKRFLTGPQGDHLFRDGGWSETPSKGWWYCPCRTNNPAYCRLLISAAKLCFAQHVARGFQVSIHAWAAKKKTFQRTFSRMMAWSYLIKVPNNGLPEMARPTCQLCRLMCEVNGWPIADGPGHR